VSSADIVAIVASVLSIVAALVGAGAAYRFKLCHNIACCGGTVNEHGRQSSSQGSAHGP
jgi:hypothetical protein